MGFAPATKSITNLQTVFARNILEHPKAPKRLRTLVTEGGGISPFPANRKNFYFNKKKAISLAFFTPVDEKS